MKRTRFPRSTLSALFALFLSGAALSVAQTAPVAAPQATSCPTTSMNVSLGKNIPFKDQEEDQDCIHCGPVIPVGAIDGTVFDAAGAPATGIDVIIESKPMNRAFNVTTRNNGRYQFDGLPPGEHTVCVAYQGKLGLSRTVPLKAYRRTLSDFDLKYFDAGK